MLSYVITLIELPEEAMSEADQNRRHEQHPRRKTHTLDLLRENLRLARHLLGGTLPSRVVRSLETLSKDFNFSLGKGELQFIDPVVMLFQACRPGRATAAY